MIQIPSSYRSIEGAYRLALRLYPPVFRESYEDVMLQSLRDAVVDKEWPRAELMKTLLVDLIRSVIKENLAMMRDTLARPILLYNVLTLMALVTVLSLGFVIIEQSMLRESANDPQMGLASDIAVRLIRGESPQAALGATSANDRVDMGESLSPFAIVYDEQGRVVASTAELNGGVPSLPAGVLDEVRKRGQEQVTWAPRQSVRIASSVRHVRGANGGFVLTGRNLREVEIRKSLILKQALLVWAGLLAVIAAGTFLFGWFTKTPRVATA